MESNGGLPRNLIVIWLVAGSLAVLCSSLLSQAAHWNGEYLPVGVDSFYHARRILDTVRDFSSFYEFDRRMHAPEGSLLTWSWGYDYAMALLVRAGLALGLAEDPMAILIWIPVGAASISVALLIFIARQLTLSTAMTALAALCLALAPTTQHLHGAGRIDHHYAEFIFILGALAAGLTWLRQPENTRRAAATGLVLGLAPAVHHGLLIIQLPLLLTLAAHWLQGRRVPARSGITFAAALLLTTIAILLPSLPFRMGRFEFHTFSWFHLYVSTCTAVIAVALSRLQPTGRVILALLAGGCVLLTPIMSEIAIAQGFVAGTPEQQSREMQPPLLVAELFGRDALATYYSHLIWVAPLSAAVCAIKCSRERNSHRLLFWISSLIGLAVLFSQLQMHYVGSFALYLPWLILLQECCDRFPAHAKRAISIAAVAFLLLYYPPLRHQLTAPIPTADDTSFRETRPLLASLNEACAEDPGIVLADTDVAHYILYYTECSVISNNLLLTPQHFEKVEELRTLSAMSPRQFVAKAPRVKYVLARPEKIEVKADGKLEYRFRVDFPRLPMTLLQEPADALPPEFALLDEVRLPTLNDAVFARLYKLQREVRAATPAGSAAAIGERRGPTGGNTATNCTYRNHKSCESHIKENHIALAHK